MAKVLIIEDDVQVRNLLAFILEREGFETVTAENGTVVPDIFKDHRFDVVLLDLFMPEKDGLETIQDLREKCGMENIIAISGGGDYGMYDFLKVARNLGAKATFAKPIDRKKLVSAIRSMAREKAA